MLRESSQNCRDLRVGREFKFNVFAGMARNGFMANCDELWWNDFAYTACLTALGVTLLCADWLEFRIWSRLTHN